MLGLYRHSVPAQLPMRLFTGVDLSKTLGGQTKILVKKGGKK